MAGGQAMAQPWKKTWKGDLIGSAVMQACNACKAEMA
jgi:hypothetical protein